MAKKIDLEVTLNTELKNVGGSVEKLKKAGAFSGEAGAKQLAAIQTALAGLQKVDLSKLKGPELTNFLNNLAKLRQYLDTAARGLTNFSDDYKKALDKVEAATRKVATAQDKLGAATAKQLKATEKAQEALKTDGYTYYNTRTGGNPRSAKAIAEAWAAGELEATNAEGKKVHHASLESHLKATGVLEVGRLEEEIKLLKQELKETKETLKGAKAELENTPQGSDINPVSKEVVEESTGTRQTIADIKDWANQETEDSIRQVNLESEKLNLNLEKQRTSLGKAFKQFTAFAIGLRMVKKALREAVGTVKELDRALTEQAMVTGLTRKQTYGLLKDYQNMASRLGATTKEVSSTMTEFLRQGRSITEATKLTEAAVAAAKVAGISAADSINYLTTAINGFRLSAEDAMKVSDKFAAVAATAAVSYEEIAVALSKVAAQANLAGMSIDYTTALLTKGIETTREAPETIGTALKTVIARMRELGDYGETLEGDTDVNNVETQLAYIGIQLRDNKGELKSTEDVLNDLGAKWDDLNANQQAAIAKALAGTRQQSRLIAMMQDYERVTELQQIASRSAGATMAQMATYLEGMDAALNKVNVAWEKIVSSIVDSQFIINLVNGFADLLDYVGTIFSETQALVPIMVLLILKGTEYIGLKLQEQHIARETQKINAQIALNDMKAKRDAQRLYVENFKKQFELKRKEIAIEKEKTKQEIIDLQATGKIDEAEKNKRIAEVERASEIALAAVDAEEKARADELKFEEEKLKIYDEQVAYREKELSDVNTLTQAYSGYANVFTALGRNIKNVLTTIPRLITAFKTAKATADASKGSLRAQSAAYIPVIGWAISLILEGISIATIIGQAVHALGKWIDTKSRDNSAEEINKSAAAIYNLNKKATELQTVVDKFEDLDKKIIKTNQDLEEMNSLLASAGDSLTDDEQEAYEKFQTNAGRKDYLKRVIEATQKELELERASQRTMLLNASSHDLQHNNSSEWASARDSIYALNNAELYKIVDNTQDLNKYTEKLVQTLLEELSVSEALELLRNQDNIKAYVASVQNGIGVFMDETQSLKDRVAAYKELSHSIDGDLLPALRTAYAEWETFSQLNEYTLDWLDSIRASADDLNDLAKAMREFGIDSGQELEYIERLAGELQLNGISLKTALEDIFGENAQEMLLAYEKAFGTTLLNMGQDMTKFTNKIDSVYEKAAAWNTMTATERTQFMSENEGMFKGVTGQDLLNAFNSGDYQQIAKALAANEALKEERQLLLDNLEIQLAIEEARNDEEKDYARIQELKEYKKYLEDTKNLYLASLETRLKQQQEQLDAYKDYLQRENDALKNALEKRKEAYQKYFDDINQTAEDQEYDDKAMTLIANISKLSSSTNADAIAKTADLTKQLEKLEKERLEELRTRAQELVIQNIEDKVTEISDNLEKLLNNEQALLVAMTNDAKNPAELIAAMMSAEAAKGDNTQLGMESYLQQLESTFKVLTPGFNWDDINVTREGDSLILNIAGQNPIDLTNSEQQTIYDAIFKALKDIGKF